MGLAAASHFIVNVASKHDPSHFPVAIFANVLFFPQSPKQAQVHSPTFTRTITMCLSRARFSSWLLRISISRKRLAIPLFFLIACK